MQTVLVQGATILLVWELVWLDVCDSFPNSQTQGTSITTVFYLFPGTCKHGKEQGMKKIKPFLV